MSFKGTHTPSLSEIKGKAKYQCPMEKRNGADAYYLTPELEERFRKLYPVTINRNMMRMFGISFSTLQRFKRKLGLTKKKSTITKRQTRITKRVCEKNGYYESLRGQKPSEACIEATKRMRSTGWHPMDEVRKNKRRYNRLMQKRSDVRKELYRKERLREHWGLERETNIRIPYSPLGRKRTSFRSTCKAVGYIPGDAYDELEKWIIRYDVNTQRSLIREANGIKLGFTFEQQHP